MLLLGFNIPGSMDYQSYHNYLDEELPPESPYLYGLHPNAEIGFLTMTSEHLFRTVLEMQPRDGAGGGAAGMTKEEKVRTRIDGWYGLIALQ
jgi:dynein heavy chain